MNTLLKKPIITEKTLSLANQENIYTFEVDYAATKSQIKTLVEELFDVKVERVNIAILPSKRRRVGAKRMPSLKTVQKKAMVKVEAGKTIELFDTSA
jgi:large subunit ribosomal protein L23